MHLSKACVSGTVIALACATSAISAATQVNITDPRATTRAALVEPGSRLAVQDVPPSSYFHKAYLGAGPACTPIATPPAGKALIVREVRVHSAYTSATFLAVYANTDCSLSGIVGEADLPIASGYTITFNPGIAIPAGGTLSANGGTGVSGDFYVDGYTVSSPVVPAVGGQTIAVQGTMHR
jgi:hypothetical protein